ncbi:hypothetical protein GQR60_08355 [Labilibaculum sp. A4]|uniref:hypothetical protein n=1 Tax=Labilibaculum euxinus TaxID=2686357 RepID=UPI000F62842E|nr:hypothetical protein [Labilibaculum euxinus]MDQ1769791.1 hypothetical protein [Labilibaculum euxinus]MWN76349.1 hypothetical protein [Labilibaculum euxinus]
MKDLKVVFLNTFILFGTLSVFAQKEVIILHPVVGDTIDLAEKQTYLLFADVDDSAYDYGQVMKEGDNYFLNVHSQSGEKLIEVDQLKLEEYHTNIQKLLAYYSYLENPDQLKEAPLVVLNQKDTCVLEMDIEYLSPKMRKKLKYDSSRYQTIKSTAEEMEFWVTDKSNYIHTSGYFEILESSGK